MKCARDMYFSTRGDRLSMSFFLTLFETEKGSWLWLGFENMREFLLTADEHL